MVKQFFEWLFGTSQGRIAAVVFGFWLMAPHIAPDMHKTFYTVSLLIKDILMFCLPVVVIIFIAASLSTFESKAPLLIFSLMAFEFMSNAMSVMFAYGIGNLSLEHLQGLGNPESVQGLTPFFSIGSFRPKYWSADKGMLVGVVLGLSIVLLKNKFWHNQFLAWREVANQIFVRFVSKLAPLFLLGFLSNMYTTGLGDLANVNYLASFGIATLSMIVYVVFLYGVAAEFGLGMWVRYMKNALPSLVMSLSTMCSITTMPYTIMCAEKNLKKPSFAKMIIPATTNIQQIADCLLNAFFCIILLKTFGKPIPDLADWLIFVSVFATARFATAGVLGGAIFIMMPLYEKYLGFNSEMCAIIFALNVLFDPIVTAGNVYANGALCIVFEKFWGLWERKVARA